MPVGRCKTEGCGKIIDLDGYFEHGVESLFYCECGTIYDMPKFFELVPVPKQEVDLSDLEEQNTSDKGLSKIASRGIFIYKDRWKKPGSSSA